MSFLFKSKVLGLFVNNLSSNDKYSAHYSENFTPAIQMQLSNKPKKFSKNSIAFLKST